MVSVTRPATDSAARPKEENVRGSYNRWKSEQWEHKASDYYTKVKEVLGNDFKIEERRPIIQAFRRLRTDVLDDEERSKLKIEVWKSLNKVWINHSDMADDQKREFGSQIDSASTAKDTLKVWRSGIAAMAQREQNVSPGSDIDQREYDSYRDAVVKIHDNGRGDHLGENAESNAHAYWAIWDNMYSNYMTGRSRGEGEAARTTPPPPVDETESRTRTPTPPPPPPPEAPAPRSEGRKRSKWAYVAAGVVGAALLVGGGALVEYLNHATEPAPKTIVSNVPNSPQTIAPRGVWQAPSTMRSSNVPIPLRGQPQTGAQQQRAPGVQYYNTAVPVQQPTIVIYSIPAVTYIAPIVVIQPRPIFVVASPSCYPFFQTQIYCGGYRYYGGCGYTIRPNYGCYRGPQVNYYQNRNGCYNNFGNQSRRR